MSWLRIGVGILCLLPYVVASQTLTANDPGVLYTGRFVIPDTATDPALFAWPFTQMACSFRGVEVVVDLKGASTAQRMRVMVDGHFTRYVNVPANTRDTYVLAAGLENIDHEVRLWKVTDWEEDSGYMKFYSFSLPSGGQFNPLPARKSRKLEFIGDSDSAYGQFYGREGCVDSAGWLDLNGDSCSTIAAAGACQYSTVNGVTASEACCGCGGGSASSDCTDIVGWLDAGGDTCSTIAVNNWCPVSADYAVNGVDANQACCGCKHQYAEVYDSTQNWAAQVASSFGAEMMVEAVARYGATDSADGNIQSVTDHIIPHDATYSWDHRVWTPDAILIMIGQNDDSAANSFVSDYVQLLNRLATKYAAATPKPKLIQVCGGSSNGLEPCAKIHIASKQFNAASSDHPGFESYFTTIAKLNYAIINPSSSPSDYTASDEHYNTQGAAILANDITLQLAQIMGWNSTDSGSIPTPCTAADSTSGVTLSYAEMFIMLLASLAAGALGSAAFACGSCRNLLHIGNSKDHEASIDKVS